MGITDKLLDMMRLNDDDEDDYPFDEEYEDDDYEEENTKPSFFKKEKEEAADKPVREKASKNSPKITPISKTSRKQASGMEVVVIKPTSVEDSREITETLLNDRTVVLNVEGLDVEIAQRIIDFTSGSCFAINGNLQKISNYIFIITPETVDISGDFQNYLDSFDLPGGFH